MPEFTDICRICLEDVDYQELQEINVPKLHNLITSRPFLNFSFLQKWQTELFVNHLICTTCILNFRTILRIYKNSCKANNAIVSEKNKHKITKVNLKRLARFSDVEGDFLVCRLCLKPTMKIAIYLYDNDKNILPMEYIGNMLKHIKMYLNANRTINPILCEKCWEDIQVAYSFSKRLEIVTEKMFYYQALIDKIYIHQEDLRDVLYMWDNLGIIDIKTEVDIVIKQELKEENKPELKDLKAVVKKLEKPPRMQNINCTEYSFHDDHSYFKLDTHVNISEIKITKSIKPIKRKRETTKRCIEESSSEMPLLKSNIEGDEECKEMPKPTPNIKTAIINTKGSHRLLRSQMHFMAKNQNIGKVDLNVNSELPQLDVEPKRTKSNKKLKVIMEKQELRKPVRNKIEQAKNDENKQFLRITKNIADMQNIQEEIKNSLSEAKSKRIKKDEKVYKTECNQNKKRVKKEKMLSTLQKKQGDKTAKNTELLKLLTTETSRPTTRLSTKKEIVCDLYSQDLLVLRKEEIIKKKRQKRTINPSFPKHTSTPKISKSKQNVSVPAIENSPSKSNGYSEYTFETLNLEEEVNFKKEVIEEEELQIKRENLSECESDDHFAENTGCTTYVTEDFDDECPNLESFIKSEYPDESYVTDWDEEGPPELEFQGPCQIVPAPMPCFTIQNTFTVDEKRNLINTVDEKRNLINNFEEKVSSIKPSVDVGSRINIIEDKRFFPPPLIKWESSQTDESKSKGSNEKTRQKTPFLKIKGDLFKPASYPICAEKDRWSKSNHNLSINVTNPDAKATLTFEDRKKQDMFAGTSNINESNIEDGTSKSSEQPDPLCKVQSSVEKSDKGQKEKIYCPKCDYFTVSQKASKAHLKRHATNSLTLQKCESCSFVSTEFGLRKHMYIHDATPYFCQMCDFSSSSRLTINSHLKLHSTNALRLYKCEICTFASTQKIGLEKHMTSKHKNSLNTSAPITNLKKSGHRYGWMKEEVELLMEQFGFYIKNKIYPTAKDIRKFIKEKKIQRTVKSVRKKIKLLWLSKDADFCFLCKYVINEHAKKISCCNCVEKFHPFCYKKNQIEMKTNKCQHRNISDVPVNDINPSCDRCKFVILKGDNEKSCSDCNKKFHAECLKEIHSTFNCQHRSTVVLVPVEDIPKPNGKKVCDYCGQVAHKSIVCLKCKRIFHHNCLIKHTERTSDCKYFKESAPVTGPKQI